MAADSLFLALWEDFKASLEAMGQENGYHLDYGPVEEDADITWESAKDARVPPISMMYAGDAEQDPIYGGEMATQRFRRFSGIVVSVPILDPEGQHSRRQMQVQADLHKALMATTAAQVTANGGDRGRGSGGRASTFEARTAYQGNQDGGVLQVTYYVRWDHVSGDMSSQ